MARELDLNLSQIRDVYERENFERIQEEWNDLVFTKGDFRFYTIEIDAAVENYEFVHNLGFIPKDILVSYNSGESFTFHYDDFTERSVFITTLGAAIIRCFIGSMDGATGRGDISFSAPTGGTGGGTGPTVEQVWDKVNGSVSASNTAVIDSVDVDDFHCITYDMCIRDNVANKTRTQILKVTDENGTICSSISNRIGTGLDIAIDAVNNSGTMELQITNNGANGISVSTARLVL